MKITMKKLMELNDKTQRLVSESLDEDEVKKVVNSAVSVYDGDEDEDVNEIDVSKLFEFYMDALNKLDMKAVYQMYVETIPDMTEIMPEIIKFYKNQVDIMEEILKERS